MREQLTLLDGQYQSEGALCIIILHSGQCCYHHLLEHKVETERRLGRCSAQVAWGHIPFCHSIQAQQTPPLMEVTFSVGDVFSLLPQSSHTQEVRAQQTGSDRCPRVFLNCPMTFSVLSDGLVPRALEVLLLLEKVGL